MPTRDRKAPTGDTSAPAVQRYRRKDDPPRPQTGPSNFRSPVLDVIGHGGGLPLDDELRQAMEARLGEPFDTVRLHIDARSTESVEAIAYTVGDEVVVHPEFANLTSPAGRGLLAHELSHVIQQRTGPVDATPVGGGIALSDPSDRCERAAELTARQAISAPPQRERHEPYPPGSPSTAPSGVATVQRRIFESSEVVRQGGGKRAVFGDLLDQLDTYHIAPSAATLSALISACHRWLANPAAAPVLARPLVEQIRSDAVGELRKLGGVPPQPAAALAGPVSSQRVAGGSISGIRDGAKVPLQAPANAPRVELTIHRGSGPAPSLNHVTPAEFLKLEAAWGMFLSGVGGLQLKPADAPDLTYNVRGDVAPAQTDLKHDEAAGTGGFDTQSRQLIDRVAAELGRSPAARSLFVTLVGTHQQPTAKVVRLFLGDRAVGMYDSGANFGYDITHENFFADDPVQVGGHWAGMTKGELLMHVLEERYYMIHHGDPYSVAHAKCLAPGSAENRYREDRARELGGAQAATAPTVAIDCAAYNAPAHMALDPKQGKTRETELHDFIAIDAVKNVTRVMGIDTDLLFTDMPAPSPAMTTTTNEPADVDAYFNKAYEYCLQSAMRHQAMAHKLTSEAPVVSETFANNVKKGMVPFDSVWTLVAGGMPPTASQRANATRPAQNASPIEQLQHRWTEDFAWAGLEVQARRLALLATSAQTSTHVSQLRNDATVMSDRGNAYLLQQRQQRDAMTKAINDAFRHRDENCAAVTIGAIHLKSAGEMLMDFRDLSFGGLSAGQKGSFPRPAPQTSQYEKEFDQQNPEAWLLAIAPGSTAPGTAAGYAQYESDKGDAVWNGHKSLLERLAIERTTDQGLGGGATWSVEQFKEPNMPGAFGYRPGQGAVPVAQLLPKMRGNDYPNGTQFVLWVFAPAPDQMMHYLYAEKLDGHVLIEDYQATKLNRRFRQASTKDPQYAALDAIPPKPLAPFTPNYFTHGCFYALKPAFP